MDGDGARHSGRSVSHATSTSADMSVGHDSDTITRTGSDQAPKPVGTGVFMPMIGRSSSRSKPQRRRNASTSCLSDHGRSTQPQRNNSSTNLLGPRAGTSSGAMLIPGSANSLYPGMAQPAHQPSTQDRSSGVVLPAGFSRSATAAMLSSATQPLNVAGQQAGLAASPQPQVLLAQQQQVQAPLSPFAAVLSGSASSTSNSPRFDSLDSEAVPLNGCMSLPGDAGLLAACGSVGVRQPSVSTASSFSFMPHSDDVAQRGPQALLIADPTGSYLPGFGIPDAAVHPAPVSGSGPAPGVRRSASFSGTGGAISAQPVMLSSSSLAGNAEPIMSQWASLGLSEQDVLSALTHVEATRTDVSLEQQQDAIEQHINKLNLMKQLLQLKQQHKAQQRLLQLQQQQQEQLLQQQLMTVQASGGASRSPSTETQSLQQELLQLLQRQTGEDVPIGMDASGMVQPRVSQANPSLLSLDGMLAGGGAASNLGLLSTLQPQHGEHAVQHATDAAGLGSLLQERLTLRQIAMSAPSNLVAPQQLAAGPSGHLLPPQSLVLQGWGHM